MKKAFLLLFFITLLSFVKSQELFIKYSNPEIEYSGRIDTLNGDGAKLFWSGSTIKINFKGEKIDILLKDSKGEDYYNVFIDNDSFFILRPDTTKKYYLLASNLPNKKHTIKIFKRTEFTGGTTTFYGFRLSGKKPQILKNDQPKKRKIEFYGNSITAGYAVEDTTGNDSPDSTNTNNYLSYSAITARHFNAEYQCVCKSGIGITISWFPYVMPDIYDRLDPMNPESKWDFSKYKPDIVVVNLFQNDSWLVNKPERKEFKQNFGKKVPDDDYFVKAYENFIKKLRDKYPDANIICMIGNMDITKKGSKWPGIVKKAVNDLNDRKIYTLIVPFKGTPGHPSIKEQQILADSLINFIDRNIKW